MNLLSILTQTLDSTTLRQLMIVFFYEGERPRFDERPHQVKKQRIRRRELGSSLVIGRATLPVLGARSVQMTYHNIPLELLPPPIVDSYHLSEHSYAKH